MANDAVKHDSGKPPMDLLSRQAKVGLAHVLDHGGRKYGRHNWRRGMKFSRLIAAAHRHLDAFNDGEDIDPEDGLPHIDHAQACLHFLSHYVHAGEGVDDRYVPKEHIDATQEDSANDPHRPQEEATQTPEVEGGRPRRIDRG